MDEEKLKSLFYKYYRPLVNYAKSILKSESKAKDAVQDVFLKLWSDQIILIENTEKSLLFTMTLNGCIDQLRKDEKHSHIKEIISSLLQTDDVQIDNIWLKEKIYKSLRHLPPKCKEVFTLSKFNGLTYREIADHLDISIKTVESQMYKAYKIIRENW